MVMNDDVWYVVRNTRGVTGFVGPDSKQPVPLSDAEMRSMGIKNDAVEVGFELGDTVMVISGVWENTIGVIKQINTHKQIVTISVDMFGRETPVEISFSDVKISN
jgi:transcriptional antiterminator NusG